MTVRVRRRGHARVAPRCARCREREARYGFLDWESLERPRTLCFECFRLELIRREQVAEQLARAANATQLELPLFGEGGTKDARGVRNRQEITGPARGRAS
jgi:hypothetical protein